MSDFSRKILEKTRYFARMLGLAALFLCVLPATSFAYDCGNGGDSCETAKFTVTTTNLNANGTFTFTMSAAGNFNVSCGDGGVLAGPGVSGNTITRTNTTYATYACTYSTGGVKTIRFNGVATAYTTTGTSDYKLAPIAFYNNTSVSSVSGDLSAIFPDLGPNNGQYPRFIQTFYGCTNLTSIPDTLFTGYTTAHERMFEATFFRCTGLTSIPAGLFAGVTGAASYMFYFTFGLCTNLTGYIPPSTFAGLIANNHPTATYMWSNTFDNTNIATSCARYPNATQYITGYEADWNGRVSCLEPVTVAYYCDNGKAIGKATATYGSEFTPMPTTGCSSGNDIFMGWAVSGTNDIVKDPFTWNYTENKTLTATREKFTVTTTNLNANDTFTFTMSAAGKFYVSCGDGGVLSGTGVSGNTITRTDTTFATYTCTYSTGGIKTIRFNGVATAYSNGPNNYRFAPIAFYQNTSVSSVSGDLSAIFPDLGSNEGQYPRFMQTFYGCTNLTSIPAKLFAGYTTARVYMFYLTFYGCRGLTSIPAGLFAGVKGAASDMFEGTFSGCTGLTSIPAGLFAGVTGAATYMFNQTFSGCTNLTGYIPPSTFAGLIANNHPTTTNMWSNTFAGTNIATSCASYPNTTQYITGYEGNDASRTWNGRVSCIEPTPVTVTYYCDNGKIIGKATATYGREFTPAATTGCSSGNAIFMGWAVSGTNDIVKDPFTWNYTENKTLTAIWEKFTVTTTNLNANDTFTFTMSAVGKFNVFCGDGGVLSGTGVSGNTITRTDTTYATYTCTYSTGGVKTIKFSGVATAYNSVVTLDYRYAPIAFYQNTSVSSVSGDLSAIFPDLGSNEGQYPRFMQTFYGCTNLTSIPDTLFAGYTTARGYMFYQTFYGCTGLTSIPAKLFAGVRGAALDMFSSTFRGCTGLTSIPAGLFAGVTGAASYMFFGTFSGCTGLTSIPAELFAGVKGAAVNMFNSTFSGCRGLTSIPAGLFAGVTGAGNSMFDSTFSGCTNLTGYIPPSTFAGLIANNHPTASNMWSNTFANTNIATSCASYPNTTQYITGYEGNDATLTWNGRVSCIEPTPVTVTYSCGDGITGNAPADTTATYGSEFTPAATTGCSSGNDIFMGWAVSGTNDIVKDPFTWNYAGNKTLTAIWEKFTVTTTNLNANDTFTFTMSAVGKFYVSCGDGGVLSGTGVLGNTITRTNTTYATYTCTYSTGGVKTIRFSGVATAYNSTGTINYTAAPIAFYQNTRVSSVSGDLSAIFPDLGSNNGQYPRFIYTFRGCTNLTSIPAKLFARYTTAHEYMFGYTFLGCTGLTSIPAGLFVGVRGAASNMFFATFHGCTGLTSIPDTLFAGVKGAASSMFESTFYGCTGLTSIPAKLFPGVRGAASSMFGYTFKECTGLTSIPAGLFAGVTGAATYMFESTFYGCTGLTSIPAELFAGVTGAASNMFNQTFYGCTNLTGYIPPSTFAGLIANNHPTTTNMWSNTFANTNIATSCASYPNTTQYITGYEGNDATLSWNGRVSCIDLFTVTYSCGDGITGNAPADTTATSGSEFTPAATTGCSSGNAIFVGWAVSGTNDIVKDPFTWNYTENKTLTAIWAKFTVTTTNLNANGTFTFTMSAVGNFNVFCGDGGVLSGTGVSGNTITRTDTTYATYTCTYSTGGVKTISFNGVATAYNTGTTNYTYAPIAFYQNTSVSSVSGDLSAIFPNLGSNNGKYPRFIRTFWGCKNLTSIPDTLFTGYTTAREYMFSNTFYGCTGLTSIPAGLFAGVRGAAIYMFYHTFYGCTELTSIPAGLFAGVTGAATYMFNSTFYGCTGLTSIPAGLFAGVTGAATYMFYDTFNGCTNLTGYIPPSTFAGLIANNHPTASNMWSNTFTNTNIATSCASYPNTTQYITGYEGNDVNLTWNGRVSCIETTTCAPGEYLPQHYDSCVICPTNSYCAGGSYASSETIDQGINQCPNNWYSPAGMSSVDQCGRALHIGDGFVYMRGVKKTTPSLHVKLGDNIFYGNATTLDVPMSSNTQRKLKVLYDNTIYSIYDDSIDLSQYQNE